MEGRTPARVWQDHTARYHFARAYVQGKAVLDIACGTGYGSEILLRGGAARVLGIDISEEAIRFAIARYGTPRLEFGIGDVLTIPSPDHSFERIISFETIEHVNGPQKALEEMSRVLAPGGILVVSSPNRELTSPRKKRQEPPVNPFHLTEFTAAEFLDILSGLFEVLETFGQRGVAKWTQFPPLRELCSKFTPRWSSPERGEAEPEKRRRFKDYRYIIAVCRKKRVSPPGQ